MSSYMTCLLEPESEQEKYLEDRKRKTFQSEKECNAGRNSSRKPSMTSAIFLPSWFGRNSKYDIKNNAKEKTEEHILEMLTGQTAS